MALAVFAMEINIRYIILDEGTQYNELRGKYSIKRGNSIISKSNGVQNV